MYEYPSSYARTTHGQQGPQDHHMGRGGQMGPLRADPSLLEDISRAVVAEVHAYHFYERLAQLAPTAQDRETILRIQRDEARHYHWFTMLLRRLNAPLPQIPPGDVPTSFEQGVRQAIRDELEAAAFYQNIASRAEERPIQMHFMHASHDEQRHASWFQYMLMNLMR